MICVAPIYGSGFIQQSLRPTSIQRPLQTLPTPPPQASGYTLSFQDDFRSFDVGSINSGPHTWYDGWRSSNDILIPGASISMANSVLSLDWQRGQTLPDTSITSFNLSAGEGAAFRYGYYEARMKWDVVPGAWPAFWLLATIDPGANSEWGEIDIFEGQGAQPNEYFGTVNDWKATNGVVSVSSNKNDQTLLENTDFAQWHTYGVLWEPGTVTWYFDDQPIITAATPGVLDEEYVKIILGSQEGASWKYGNLTGVTPNGINLSVDWVRVRQRDPTNKSYRVAAYSLMGHERCESNKTAKLRVPSVFGIQAVANNLALLMVPGDITDAKATREISATVM